MSPATLTRRQACLAPLAAAAASVAAPAAFAKAAAPLPLHVLQRLSYGPAPGDLQRIAQDGTEAYIQAQLRPEALRMPAALEARLQSLAATQRSPAELVLLYRETVNARDAEGMEQRRLLYRQMALEAGEARLLRALHSPAQLQEVMVEFWFNHFNVFIGKGLDRVLVAHYERTAIRPHALGRFRDLLGATARHPAMLFYLDNWLSSAPGFRPARAAGAAAGGLNENYARELMELHTLGVAGGYTQADVTELARILTGWTIAPRNAAAADGSAFFFDPRRHDGGEKQWLGRRIAARGLAEGEQALDVLASHPATARHIGFKLAQAFVADVPPEDLVQALAHRFASSDGDIRAVLQTLFDSAAFRAPQAAGAKFKTPYRYLLSGVRAAGLEVQNVRPLQSAVFGLGMALHGCVTPDGYRNTEVAWLNPDAMARRIQFATALASGRLPLARAAVDEGMAPAPSGPVPAMAPGAATRPDGAAMAMDAGGKPAPMADAQAPIAGDPVRAETLLASLGEAISDRTRDLVMASAPPLRAALVLGSPDFMRH